MITVIMGLKGMGKTKHLIEAVNNSVKESDGSVVCIEKGDKLRYDISHQARLIDTTEYSISDAENFLGFIAGLLAGNYDIHKIYVDSILKIIGEDLVELGSLLAKLETLCGAHDADICITVSGDAELAPDSVKKYLKA